MQFDTALNIVWLIFGLLALAGTVRSRQLRSNIRARGPMWLHVCGVALILAALFPYISATDDVLRIDRMHAQQTGSQHGDSGQKRSSDTLIRLYETLDAPVIYAVQGIACVLFFIALVVRPPAQAADAIRLLQGGRSPPLIAV